MGMLLYFQCIARILPKPVLCLLKAKIAGTDAVMKIVVSIFFYPEPENIEQHASWKKWEEVNGRVIKNSKSGLAEDLYRYLAEIVPPFLIHCFVKRKFLSYEEDKLEALMEQSKTMLQIDFAENFTCLAQDEVQSTHWKQNQITLFFCQMVSRQDTIPSHSE